jgi:hypothetical protein
MSHNITPPLTSEHKKILNAKFISGQVVEFSDFTKNAKNKFEYQL